jgi:hypothetical protein
MIRVCSYCQHPMGEKCGKCGATGDELTVILGDPRVPGDPSLYKCLRCHYRFEAGADGISHGVCLACMRLSQAERDRLAKLRGAERAQALSP